MAPDRDPRISKAFSAMKSMGITTERVKPVLKRLLKLYDWNWEHIEEGNYRALADAIFEDADDKLTNEKNDGPINCDSEPPCKKQHRRLPNVTSTKDNGIKILELEEDKIPQSSNRTRLVESSQSSLGDPRSESHHHVRQAQVQNRGPLGREPIRDYNFENVIKDRKKKHINCSPQFSLPTSNVGPGLVETSLFSDELEKNNGSDSAHDYRTHNIASSTCGRVIVSLNCHHTLVQHNFHIPNLDDVLKFMETKYPRSDNIVGSEFSLVKFLKKLCESYVEFGAILADRSLINNLPYNDIHQTSGPKRDNPRIDYPARDVDNKVASHSGSSDSVALVVAQRKPMNNSNGKRVVRISDITNGTEKVSISLLDEIGGEDLPNFTYVPENIIYQSAYVHVSLARIADEDCCSSCVGDCLSSSVPCACARDTRGEFAYTPEGLLTEEFLRSCISMKQQPQEHYQFFCQDCPLERAKNAYSPEKCKGHLERKFIKECWRKCGCKMICGNRVVQRGISRKLQVFLTNQSKGWGLRTLEELPKGAFVCEYAGEILTNMELYERNKRSTGKYKHTYPVLLDSDWCSENILNDEDALCLDATYYGNVSRFINHRCFDSNVIEVPVQVETPDRHYYHIAFFTKRKVDAYEELTWDYGIDFDDHNHPVKAFRCSCGSEYCRDNGKK
ncbi:Histone-lysine N-methyltransferase SUVR4 [Abeliophyllum distichum]|uniref:Histone-lysine N-methyltransferase SUVR4 n=1 Tax=Abeliophyllum distichum TaxID=126358 RepID=A0ABD1P3U5_9LAMI